jgi:hypothetical protein
MSNNNSGEKYDLNISFFLFLLAFLVLISASLIYSGITYLQDTSSTTTGMISIGLGLLGLVLAGYNLFRLQGRLSMIGRAPVGPQVLTREKCKSCDYEATRPFKEGDYVYGNGDPCTKCGKNELMLIGAIFLKKPPKK